MKVRVKLRFSIGRLCQIVEFFKAKGHVFSTRGKRVRGSSKIRLLVN